MNLIATVILTLLSFKSFFVKELGPLFTRVLW